MGLIRSVPVVIVGHVVVPIVPYFLVEVAFRAVVCGVSAVSGHDQVTLLCCPTLFLEDH